MAPKKSSLATLSNEALCKLRDEIASLLHSRAKDLRKELDQLTGNTGSIQEINGKNIKLKIAPKYRGPNGDTWSGRGIKPRWLANEVKEGKNIEDFLIRPTNGS